MVEVAQYQIKGTTAREIAASAEQGIREGMLDPGTPLPTVRSLAQALGSSPATVSSGYRILQQRGLVVAEGRRGTRVAPRPALRRPARVALPQETRDLSVGLPDPALLPPLDVALGRVDLERKLRTSELDYNDPELLELAAQAFASDGLPSDSIAVVGGAFDGIERVLQAHLRPGDRVLIEDPTYPAIRDLLLALSLVAVPVPVDESGLIPAALRAQLTDKVAALVVVPRAQNPLGAAMDDQRVGELLEIFDSHPEILMVEDDHGGPVSGAAFSSLVGPQRHRWAVIRSMSKMLHPDLRVALMAGDETTIARAEGRQALGTRWVSHVMQATVLEMLRDPAFPAYVERATEAYATRRRWLIDALADVGVPAYGRSGLNVWVQVREELPVARALLDSGWLVTAGERFRIRTPPGVRITIATLERDEAAEIAGVIAAVEHAGRSRGAY